MRKGKASVEAGADIISRRTFGFLSTYASGVVNKIKGQLRKWVVKRTNLYELMAKILINQSIFISFNFVYFTDFFKWITRVTNIVNS